MTRMNVTIAEMSNESLYAKVCDAWRDIARHAIERKGFVLIGLSGGKTPQGLYTYLATHLDALIWKNTRIVMVDERMVASDHPDSNTGMVYNTLVDRIAVSDKPVVYKPQILNTVETTATGYEDQLHQALTFPLVFDVLLLGLGEDGHIASLFTLAQCHNVENKVILPIKQPGINHERISLSLSVINQSKHIFFVVCGESKARMIKDVLERKVQVPACCVNPLKGKVQFFLDQASSALL